MMGRIHSLSVALGLIGLVACSSPPVVMSRAPIDVPDPLPPGAAELRRDLLVLASDSFRGRETGTADEARAAAFLAARAAGLGLSPAGDSGYVQRIPLVRTAIGSGTQFMIHQTHGEGRALDGLRPLMELGPDLPPIRRQAEGPIVFVGYGLEHADHTDDLAHVPIAGHIVVVVNGAPSTADASRRAELESPAAIAVRLQRILSRHPAGVIVLLAGASADVYETTSWALRRGTLSGAPAPDRVEVQKVESRQPQQPGVERSVALPHEAAGDGETTPMILFGLPAHGSPLLPAHWPRDDRPQVLHGRFTGTVEVRRTVIQSYNVLAAIPGHDSARRNTWVALGAHYDHLGILPAVRGDSVAHGADDDGSGCVALLAAARTMMQGPRPSRSVLFVWHTGEEKGLLGSTYFTSHPTVPIDSVVAFIDADMVGRNASDSLYVVGPETTPEGRSRNLGLLVDSVNVTLPVPFVFNRAWDVATDPRRIYYRADSYPYGEHGVPVVLFTSGPHADYHQVTDVASRIDYGKLARVSRLLMEIARAVADRGGRL